MLINQPVSDTEPVLSIQDTKPVIYSGVMRACVTLIIDAARKHMDTRTFPDVESPESAGQEINGL